MAIREITMEVKAGKLNGEQLTFSAFALADCVRELAKVEQAKKDANADYNDEIKGLKKQISKLAIEISAARSEERREHE